MKKYCLLLFYVFQFSLVCFSQTNDTTKASLGGQGYRRYLKPDQLNDGIKTATLKEVQINEGIIKSMQDSIAGGLYANIHSILILRHNKLVYERYFPGSDVIRGIGSVGFVDHHRDSLHDIKSVSKSIVSAAVMIAVGLKKIKSLDQRVLSYFPEYAKYDTGMKQNITIQHLLNMSSGLEWNEEISYADTTNSEIKMNRSLNAIDFILSRKMADTPGYRFNYSGGCTQLLAGIVERVTGMEIDVFTEQYLFKPLGISAYTWVKINDGKPSAASGLRLRSRDMAKFGLLYINNGRWNGKQIIPSHLVAQTLRKQISTPYNDSTYHMEYSNQFWMLTEVRKGKEISWVQCQGNGGQIIIIDKVLDLVAVITAGTYNQGNLRKSSWDIYMDFIYPAVVHK